MGKRLGAALLGLVKSVKSTGKSVKKFDIKFKSRFLDNQNCKCEVFVF